MPGLDDPDYAAFAWARYRRMLGWMALAAALVTAAAVIALEGTYGPLSWVAVLATIGGVFASVMLAAALMGLMFLSSGSGHDAQVDERD